MNQLKMYDYMQALQDKFFHPPKFPELEQQIDLIHRELSQQLDKDARKKLLHLIDAAEELQEKISLISFIAGFRLAIGLARELSLDERYSFAKDQESRTSELAEISVSHTASP